ncbi:MAG: HD-GYP domain-containing protein [Provencibacterium sp.]|jgi:HD-GYP domain-containing protein (c-di-GMP phosphodiesterase class II)|nr:HD-GYP domain-containing protein [Provencibacterium sp.]
MFSGEQFYTTVIHEASRLTTWETGVHERSIHLEIAINDLKNISVVVPLIEQSSILQALVRLLDKRDTYTAFHSERVSLITLRLCLALCLPLTRTIITTSMALVHDIGKIGIPDAILLKEGPLNEAEFDEIKQHPIIGTDLLQQLSGLTPLCPGVLHHHERWDGKGYPHGLSGEDIPLEARIIAVCDSIDAMISSRVYRKALSKEHAYDEIKKNRGVMYDPEVVDTFLKYWEYIL